MMRYLYILFSSTPYKMGRFIRIMTRNRFNHCAISLDPKFQEMYTFARLHTNMPMLGGFIKESFGRYQLRNASADILVCRIPVKNAQFLEISNKMRNMYHDRQKYLYNFYSAVCAPVRLRFRISDSYTCAEFVGDILGIIRSDIAIGTYHDIDEMATSLQGHVVYDGKASQYPADFSWGDDGFPYKVSVVSGTCKAATRFAKLTTRAMHSTIKKFTFPFDKFFDFFLKTS